MCECNRFFNPDEFLEKRCTFLYFVIFIHLILGILFAVFSPNGNGYTFLFQHFIQALILFCGIRTLLYTYLAIYIFFSLVNCVSSFIVVGIVLQQLIAVGSNEVSKKLDTAYIVLTAFNFVFLVFSIIFQLTKK